MDAGGLRQRVRRPPEGDETETMQYSNEHRIQPLLEALSRRLLVLDGAMGTMLQRQELDETAFRGSRFLDSKHDLRGNNDLLCLTQPGTL